jgi:DNA-binding PadR family transcriptional regulator
MSSFSEKGLLTDREQLVMLAAMRLGDEAYAVSIQDEIEARTGIVLRHGSVYEALERLARRGYLTSFHGDPTPERGGRAKRFVVVTAAGKRALDEVAVAIARMKGRPGRVRGTT